MGRTARNAAIVLVLAAGAYIWAAPEHTAPEANRLEKLTRIATQGTRAPSSGPAVPTRDVAMAQPKAPATSPALAEKAATTTPARPQAPLPIAPHPEHATPASGTAGEQAAGKMPSRQAGPVAPAANAGTAALVRSIQAGLKRVGCFAGLPDGIWSATTREAMQRFLDRIDTQLPVAEPDYILLTIVQGRKEVACPAACAQGVPAAPGGHCRVEAVAKAPPASSQAPIVAPGVRLEKAKAQERQQEMAGSDRVPAPSLPRSAAAQEPASLTTPSFVPARIAVAVRPRPVPRPSASIGQHERRRHAGKARPRPARLGRGIAAPRPVARPVYVARPLRAALRVRVFGRAQTGGP
ncbi:MAG: hypothetical protein R3D68_01835 [Hyphomicrobiaceae bacterium]